MNSDYKIIELEDRDLINPFFRETTQWLAEYTFSTVFSWNCGGYTYKYRIVDGVLFIKVLIRHSGKEFFLKPIKIGETLTPEYLHNTAVRENVECYICIDEKYFSVFKEEEWKKYFKVTEDTGWGDYYYLSEELAGLKGGKFAKKRNLIKQFNREYSSHGIEVKKCSAPLIMDCIRLHKKWYEEKGVKKDSTMLKREDTALEVSLKNFSYLGLSGLGMFMDGELKAFSVYERLNRETIVVHFEKTAFGYKGLPQSFLSRSAAIIKNEFKYIDREGDMNDEGLRKAKQSSRPVFIEKSYRLNIK